MKASDLGKNCYVRTIKGGNCNLIRSWIAERLNWSPSNCILVCGTQDILEGMTPCNILDDLGSLTAQLKQINEDMIISVCQLGPTLKTDELEETIVYFNEQLEEWCKENGVILIKNFLAFKLGTDEVDEICYDIEEENSGVFLSRLGVIRLLTTIAKSCHQFCLRENWNENRLLSKRDHTKGVFQRDRYEKSEAQRNFMVERNIEMRRSSYNHRKSQEQWHYSNQDRSHMRRNIFHSNNDAIETVRNVFNNENGKGCFNCGELNHRANTCRFDHRLRCGNCDRLGHKRRLCHFFNH